MSRHDINDAHGELLLSLAGSISGDLKATFVMQQIDDTKNVSKHLDERERESLIRIKETQELIEKNRRRMERSRELAAVLGRANNRT